MNKSSSHPTGGHSSFVNYRKKAVICAALASVAFTPEAFIGKPREIGAELKYNF